MNAVEIEQAVSALAEQPFDPAEFPFAFLEAFGNKETTLKRLRKGETNKSDFAGPWGGVLQTNNIHIAVAAPGALTQTHAADTRVTSAGRPFPCLPSPTRTRSTSPAAPRTSCCRARPISGNHRDLYDPDHMPADLRAAHDRNDEVLERIYTGRRFRNDTERLETLFELYTKMTASAAKPPPRKVKA
jgi:hypothetical protein